MKKLLNAFILPVCLFTSAFVINSCCEKGEPDVASGPIEESTDIETFGQIIVLNTAEEFNAVIGDISKKRNALFVFDVDNTLLITNDNKFGSDWWYAQTKENPSLKLNIDNACLFDVLTPLFYANFDTKPVFPNQPEVMDALEKDSNKIIACTSRGYSEVVGSSTVLELHENEFDFMQGDTMTLSNGVLMRNDIIYTKGKNKGVALLEYLDRHPYEYIYYFDDSFFKVENVQKAFADAGKEVGLYHMKIAPKIPYSPEEIKYMKEKLCIVIESVNQVGDSGCKCDNPK